MENLNRHHKPQNLSDKIAFAFTKFLRFLADTFFKKKYGHRAVVLETVAVLLFSPTPASRAKFTCMPPTTL